MHLSADLRVAGEEILQGHLSFGDYLGSFRRPLESAIFAWDDPLPGMLDLPLFAWVAGTRMLRGSKKEKGHDATRAETAAEDDQHRKSA